MDNKLNKLGSSTSEVVKNNNIFKKTNLLKDEFEYESIKKGISLLKNEKSDSIEPPLKIELITDQVSNSIVKIYYEQTNLKPWIKAEFITGQQLFLVAKTVLEQMEILVSENLCFVDARPENYWLAVNKGKLIDLASIKPLTLQNLLSFETDFKKHFLNPLELEKNLNIPVSSFFKGKLQSIDLNLWSFFKNYLSLSKISDLAKNSLISIVSDKISSSSPKFVEFLNAE